jgi:hypothetical protein
MFRRILFVSILAWTFFACKEGVLKIGIQYDELQGLEKGARVLFEENDIGRVTGVSYDSKGYYLVDVAIKKDFSGAATEYAGFFVIQDPGDVGRKAVEIVHTRKGGTPLESGAMVRGSTKTSVFPGQAGAQLGEGLESLKKGFEQFADDLKSLPQSEEWKRLQAELARLVEEMKRAGSSAQEMIQEDLLPKLQEEMEELRERLHEFGGEDEELEPLEEQVEKIETI